MILWSAVGASPFEVTALDIWVNGRPRSFTTPGWHGSWPNIQGVLEWYPVVVSAGTLRVHFLAKGRKWPQSNAGFRKESS